MEDEKIYITKGDAVLALLEKGQHSKRYKLGESWELNLFEIQEAIDAMPVADVQPVKHGEWKINSDGYYPYCSVCGTAADQLTKHLTKYCPNCGARMDGDAK